MSKKFSELPPKESLDSADYIPIVDSADSNPETQNKIVTFQTVRGYFTEDLDEFLEQAQTAESARVSAENTRRSSETTRNNNESTRQSNETTREANEAARQTNETARENAETGYIQQAKSWAVGTNGVTREGDATDNAKYYAEQASASASSASASATSASASATTAGTAKDSAQASATQAAISAESVDAPALTKKILAAFPQESLSGSLLTLSDGADGIPAKKLTLNLSPHQSGSGDPSPDNVRPISGYESVTVTRAGKNLAKPYLYEGAIPAGVTFKYNGDGSATLNGTQTGSGNGVPSSAEARSGGFGFLLPAGTYKPSVYGDDLTNVGCQVITTSGSVVSSGGAFTLNTDTELFIRVTTTGGAGITFDNRKIYIQLEAGITATAYEPPDMAIYSVTFPTAAGTVYGGSLVIDQDGSGTLTVDRLKINASSLTWSQSTQVASRFVAYVNPRSAGKGSPVVCSVLPSLDAYPASTVTGIFMNTATQIIANIPDITTQEDWDAMITAKQPEIVYQIENATTYTLTADQIETLLGDNSIWMDADGSIDLVYRADTQKYIDSRISALNANLAYIEDGTTASRAYSVGQYVLIGGQLYKVAASIASGATFTIGTNVVATTVGNELTALN